MESKNRTLPAVVLACALGAAGSLAPGGSAADNAAAAENTVTAAASGTVGAGGPASEPVAFSGQASIRGKVIHDTTFGAPPVLEIIVDLSQVKGRGLRSGKDYLVASQAILHRPLLPFDPIEVGFSFAEDGKLLQARSALASFSVYYTAARGITTTPVRITLHPRV
jgi:hypothetical protein